MNEEIRYVTPGFCKRIIDDVEILRDHVNDVDTEGEIVSLQKGIGFLDDALANLVDAWNYFAYFEKEGK